MTGWPEGWALNQFCVLVTSSDDRKDIFDICFADAERIWRNCDWPRYAGFTTPQPDQYGFKSLASYVENDWCRSVAAHIDALPEEIRYILLMVEDTLFMAPVEMVELDDVAVEIVRGGLSYVRLVPVRRNWLGRLFDLDGLRRYPTFLRHISPSEPYYSSTEMAIWERDYLRKQLDGPGNAWSFEHHIGKYCHWAVRSAIFNQHQIVQKGRWNRRAAWYLAAAAGVPGFRNAMDIEARLTKMRPLQTWRSFLRGEWQNLNFALFGFTSFRLKRWLYDKG